MINEEDHLRIQVLRSGFQFKKVWNTINTLDSDLEEHMDFAFSPGLGYLSGFVPALTNPLVSAVAQIAVGWLFVYAHILGPNLVGRLLALVTRR